MFKRRLPKPLLHKVQDSMWPRMGWRRTWVYANYRLGRMTASVHSLAAGFATGATISFLPLPGLHMVHVIIICLIFGFNKTAGIIGTVFGNPWTFPIIWYMAYEFGQVIFQFAGISQVHGMPSFIDLKAIWGLLLDHPFELMVPWAIGGYVCALLFWIPFYWLFYGMIENARNARRKLRMSRVRKTALDITMPKDDSLIEEDEQS